MKGPRHMVESVSIRLHVPRHFPFSRAIRLSHDDRWGVYSDDPAVTGEFNTPLIFAGTMHELHARLQEWIDDEQTLISIVNGWHSDRSDLRRMAS